jgi:SH3-like domain-containing protein
MTTLRSRLLHFGFAAALAAGLHAEPTASIKADRTNLRAKPAFDGEVLATLKKGDKLEVIDQVPGTGPDGKPRDWAKVALPKLVPVWVYGPLVDSKTKLVKGKFLNLRAGPGKNYSELGELKQGDAVSVIRELDGWLQIEPPANTFAFVAANLIELSSAGANPIAAKPGGQHALPERNSAPTPAPESKPLPAQTQPVATETVKTPVPEPAAEPPKPVTSEPAPVAAAVPAVPTPIYSNPAPVPTPAPAPATNAVVTTDDAPKPRKFLRYQPPTHSVPADQEFVPSADATEAKPREVLREGLVGRTWSVQAPGHLELLSLRDEGTLDFLFTDTPDLDLAKFRNQRVIVTGEEWRDSRWKTPLLKVKTIRSAE